MAGTRAYVRGSGGKFAGASAPGTKVTYGKAGGFANSAFRNRVQQERASKSTSLGAKAGAKAKQARNGLIGAPGSTRRRQTRGLALTTGVTALAAAGAGVSASRINVQGSDALTTYSRVRTTAVLTSLAVAAAKSTGQMAQSQRKASPKARPSRQAGKRVKR